MAWGGFCVGRVSVLESEGRAAFALVVFRLLRTGRASEQTCSSIVSMYDKIIHTVLFMKYMHD